MLRENVRQFLQMMRRLKNSEKSKIRLKFTEGSTRGFPKLKSFVDLLVSWWPIFIENIIFGIQVLLTSLTRRRQRCQQYLILIFSVKFEFNINIQVKESEQPGENENRIVVLNKKDEENGENFTG